MKLSSLILLPLALALLAGPLQARTMYIDDTLLAPVRTGESNQYRIIHSGLRSGTRVEVLDQNPDTGYSRIRFGDGKEGYILTRYLSSQPIAAERLATANAELEKVRGQLAEVRSEKQDLEKQVAELQNREAQLQKELDKVSSELEEITRISEDTLRINERNKELRESNQELKSEKELLSTENQRLKDSRESDFLLIGGGLVLAGILMALLFPMLKPSRKSDTWA
ncbi:MAG: TIGR04211 family SH3 domain-containing protein [Oleiphilaceae bacterium]|nr:TIGR04211 family SH3 domain-containing protein [Oleiphilaceae bacterium]